MSIATTVRTAGPFAGTGSLVALPFAFKVFAASDLVVQRTNVAGDVATLTLTTHYSVSLNADQDTSPGGTVTLVTALAVGETAALTSSVSATQPLQLASGGPFLPGQIEDALDRAMIVVQQQGVLGEQALRVPLGETALILPPASQRADTQLLFDSAGEPYCGAPVSGSAADVMLQYASTDAGKGASLSGVEDAADNYNGTQVEAVLAEIALRAYSVELEKFLPLVTQVGGEDRWDAAFAAAQAAAVTKKKPLYLGCNPVIKYFTAGLDVTSNDGAAPKDGLKIFGAGANQSKIVVRATTGAAMEVQGVGSLRLADFQIGGNVPIGIAGGRATVRQWCGDHYYDGVRIILSDDMLKNNGIGTIALLGIEPEESTYNNCEFWANLPAIICPPNNISVQTLTSAGSLTTKRIYAYTPAYTPIIGTLLSNTVFRFTGGCRMVSWQPNSPQLSLRTVSSLDLTDTFFQVRGGGSNPSGDVRPNPYAIDAENVWNLKWFGTCERAPIDDTKTDSGFAILSGSIENWTVSGNAGTASSVTNNKVPVIYAVDFVTAVWKNCDIKLRINGNQAQYPFGYSLATSNIQIQNCSFDISTTASLSTIPQAFLFNMSGSRIRLTGANATVPVLLEKLTRYKQKLYAEKELPAATATTVCTVVLPTTGLSSGTLQFRNVVLAANYVTGGAQTALITGEFDVSWTRTAATTNLTVTVTRNSWAASVKTAETSLDIAAPTIAAVLSGQLSFQVQLTSNLSGTGSAGIATFCSADITSFASFGDGTTTAIITTQ